jgi:hypothetical protein
LGRNRLTYFPYRCSHSILPAPSIQLDTDGIAPGIWGQAHARAVHFSHPTTVDIVIVSFHDLFEEFIGICRMMWIFWFQVLAQRLHHSNPGFSSERK